MKIFFLAFALIVPTQGLAMCSDSSAQALRAIVGGDHFNAASDNIYGGVADASIRAHLDTQFDAAALALADACAHNVSAAELLTIFKTYLDGMDRETRDTEDAEHVAGFYEKMLDSLEIESSDGILNDWLYGFDPV